MENLAFTRDLILVLTTAFLGGFLAKKLRQPLLTGYILGGVLVGAVVARFTQFSPGLTTLSEIGVALLMFTLGLEFSWTRLRRIGFGIVLAAITQILLVILLFIFLLPNFGFDFYSSLFLGSCFSLSSTAVVVKILNDRGELETLPGELSTAWLLIQDLAVLPMIVLLPALAPNLTQEVNLLKTLPFLAASLFKVVIFFFLVVFLGRKLVPFFTTKIAKTHSRELLLLAVVSFCLVLAFGTASLGFSFAFGAFLAGLLIAEIGIAQAIFAEVRPLRDVLAVIFFVSLGFLLSPEFLFVNLNKIFSLAFLIILLKLLVVGGLILYLGYHSKAAFFVGVGLTQVGEFAAVLGQAGLKTKVISSEVYFLIISVTLLTLIVTPWLIGMAPWIYRQLKNSRWPFLPAFFTRFDKKPFAEELPFADHVVLLGYGRVGKYIGRALEMAKIPFVVVDYNQRLIKELKDKGLNGVYGDPAEIDVLDFAQVDRAKAVVIAIPDRQTQAMVIANVQTLRPGIKIICRTHHEEDQAELRALRVETIIQPEFEASLAIINKLLSDFGLNPEEIDGKIKRLKIEHGMG